MSGAALKITLAQINPIVGDITGNADKVRAVRDSNPDTDLIVFPELVISGYPPEDLVTKPCFLDDIQAIINDLAVESKNKPAMIVTAPCMDNHQRFNSAYLLADGIIKARIDKHGLPNYNVFDEKRVFDHGKKPKPVDFKGYKLGIMICEDMWHPQVPGHLADYDADILIVPNGSPYHTAKHETRLHHARLRVEETGLPVIYVNQVGGQDDLLFDGASFVVNDKSELIYQAPAFKNDVHTITFPFGTERAQSWDIDGPEIIYHGLVMGTHDYVVKNGFGDKGVLIGLSGGIDSALVAAIAVDALGADKVHCVMMPSPFTSEESLRDALACADMLGVSYETLPINGVMETYESIIPGLSGLAHENMQSRARGLILMSLSNQFGKMVLSTGNKSEMAVGYATLYGDMCGGYNPLTDVYKTLVYELAKWRGLPENILTKAPSAELREGQKDADSLPPYDALDDILECLIEREMDVNAIAVRGHSVETVKKIWKLLDMAEYKRRQSAPGPKITPQPLSHGRRYPITNAYAKIIEKA